jgi:hypothetical protein
VRNGKLPPTTTVEVWPSRTIQFNEFTTVAGLRDRPGFGGGTATLSDTTRWFANPRVTLDVPASATNVFSGSVVPSSTFGRELRKSGLGRQVLSGNVSSQRLIEIDGGELAIDGTVAPTPYPDGVTKYTFGTNVENEAFMEGRFFVRSGGLLSGTGTIRRAVIFESGAAFRSALASENGLTIAAPLTIGTNVTLHLPGVIRGVLITYTDTFTGRFDHVFVNGNPAPEAAYRVAYGPGSGGGTIVLAPPRGAVFLVN